MKIKNKKKWKVKKDNIQLYFSKVSEWMEKNVHCFNNASVTREDIGNRCTLRWSKWRNRQLPDRV